MSWKTVLESVQQHQITEGDLVMVLPPSGINVNPETLKQYNESFKGKGFEVAKCYLEEHPAGSGIYHRVVSIKFKIDAVVSSRYWVLRKFLRSDVKPWNPLETIFLYLDELEVSRQSVKSEGEIRVEDLPGVRGIGVDQPPVGNGPGGNEDPQRAGSP